MAIATFGAGCFWGVEKLFNEIPGVIDTKVGFQGGFTENPTYEDVCSDETGHAEVVRVEYNPEIIHYDSLLATFWENHNPTQKNGQGADIGTQYRSAIFYHSEAQRKAAEASRDLLSKEGRFNKPIVTEISEAKTFYQAEKYHQRYLQKQGLSSCHI